ncbi:MAG: hypothetical protein J6T63_04820 [Bacteroidales bacterium]|nr:hypothetical protein [Bacteroidales bacterium]
MVKSFEKYLASGLLFGAVLMMSVVSFSCKSNDKAETQKDDKVVADSIAEDSIVEDTSLKIADCDFMYFRGNKFCFFSIERMDSIVYEGETDEIVNYSFVPGTLGLYYSVCKDSSMVLKYINFDSDEPTPKHIVNWDLSCNDCITETYGTYSALRLSSNGRYAGVNYDFSWDGYWFTKIKVYDLEANKFVKAKNEESLYDYFNEPSSEEEDEDDEVITYSSFYEAGADDDEEENEESSYNYYYRSEGKGGVCLTNKMKFESTPEEFNFSGISPKGDRVVFGAVTGWGDFPHGPFCIASLDGKYQMILDGTDLSYDEGPSMAWLDDGTFLYIANFMADVEDFEPTIMAIYPDSTKPVELFKVSEFVMLPKKE